MTSHLRLDSWWHKGGLLSRIPGAAFERTLLMWCGENYTPALRGSISARAGSDKCTDLTLFLPMPGFISKLIHQHNLGVCVRKEANLQQHQQASNLGRPWRQNACLAGVARSRRRIREEESLTCLFISHTFLLVACKGCFPWRVGACKSTSTKPGKRRASLIACKITSSICSRLPLFVL